MAALSDELKARVDAALKIAVAGAIAAAAAVAAFVCFAAVLFLWVLEQYGLIEAWLALAALFAIVALIGVLLAVTARRRWPRPGSRDTATVLRWLQEPAVVVAGLRTVQALGPRRLLPLILIGGVAAGFVMSRAENGTRDRGRQETSAHS
jgi:hypothetical protein